MVYKDGGQCGDPLVHGCEELPAACRTMMGYRPGISVFLYL